MRSRRTHGESPARRNADFLCLGVNISDATMCFFPDIAISIALIRVYAMRAGRLVDRGLSGVYPLRLSAPAK